MKRLQLPRRVQKSNLGEIKFLSLQGVGVVLLSLMLGVRIEGVYSQEKPGTRRARPNAPAPPVQKPAGTAPGLSV